MIKYGAYAANVHDGARAVRGMMMWEKSLQFVILEKADQKLAIDAIPARLSFAPCGIFFTCFGGVWRKFDLQSA